MAFLVCENLEYLYSMGTPFQTAALDDVSLEIENITSTSEQRSPVLRICCKFRIVGENFLLPNLVVAVGLLLRRANSVRPYTYIELIPQVE